MMKMLRLGTLLSVYLRMWYMTMHVSLKIHKQQTLLSHLIEKELQGFTDEIPQQADSRSFMQPIDNLAHECRKAINAAYIKTSMEETENGYVMIDSSIRSRTTHDFEMWRLSCLGGIYKISMRWTGQPKMGGDGPVKKNDDAKCAQ